MENVATIRSILKGLLGIFIILSFSIKSWSQPPAPPSVNTNAATSVTSVSANLNGTITSNGNRAITSYGFYWSTTMGFTAPAGNHVVVGTTDFTGAFLANIAGLSANTTYYFQAYATNSEGTTYGTEISFTTAAACTFTPANIPDVTINNPEVLLINAGGGVTGDWQDDNSYSPVGNVGGSADALSNPLGLVDIAPNDVYNSVLWGNPVSVTATGLTANTNYFVRVHLREDYWTVPNARIFDVDVTDGAGTQKFEDDFDIHATVGHDGIYYSEGVTSSDASGNIMVTSAATVDNGILNGVEIREFTTLTATGGGTYLWSNGETTPSISVSPNSTTIYTVTITDGSGCEGTENVTVTITNMAEEPTVNTSTATSTFNGMGTLNGNITSNGGDPVTSYGFYWSTTSGFTAPSGTHVEVGTSDLAGAFSTTLSGLTNGTTYYFQAYATNSIGTTYGTEFSFTPTDAPTYYINDNNATGDVWCTALGNTYAAGNRGGIGDPLLSLDDLFTNIALNPGDVIRIDAGTYTGWAQATVPVSGTSGNIITIEGTGTSTNITSTGTGIFFNEKLYWEVKDVQWTSNGAGQVIRSTGSGVTWNDYLTFRNSTFIQNGANDIFYAFFTDHVTVDNCVFEHNASGAYLGINLSTECRDWTLSNSSVTMLDNTVGSSCLFLNTQTRGTISGNSFINGENGIGTGSGNAFVWNITSNFFCSNDYGVNNANNLSYQLTNNNFYNLKTCVNGPDVNGLKFWTITGNNFYTTSSTDDDAGIIWQNTASNPTSLDNNNYWSPNGASIVYHNATKHGTLTSWQGASAYDGSSTEMDPGYQDAANCNLLTSAPMPINILSFHGRCLGANILFKWLGVAPAGLDHYRIEKSEDGVRFEQVTVVDRMKTNNSFEPYSFQIADENDKTSYYRLVQVNLNGEESYSEVLSIYGNCLGDKNNGNVSIHNLNGVIQVQLSTTDKTPYKVQMTNSIGQVLETRNGIMSGNKVDLTFVSMNLSAGVYYFSINIGDQIFKRKVFTR